VARNAVGAKSFERGTKGYQNHPQLIRFKATEEPLTAIAGYLQEVHDEAIRRGYQFDGSKIGVCNKPCQVEETDGQLAYEWEHIKRKLAVRSPAKFDEISQIVSPLPNPIFRIVPGEIRDWEKR
jgi:hypothetical protein